jgi:ssDNA-binding Zn-finger/Zn-ribbon topoisomerase 1
MVPLFDARVRRWGDPAHIDFPQAEFRKVYYRLPPPSAPSAVQNRREPVWLLPLLPVALLVVITIEIGSVVAALVALTLTLCVMYGAWRWWRSRFRVFPSHVRADDIVAAMLGERRCPSCAYTLERSPEPRRTVCPECGSTWDCTKGFWTVPLARKPRRKPRAKSFRLWRAGPM